MAEQSVILIDVDDQPRTVDAKKGDVIDTKDGRRFFLNVDLMVF
jgi:hypothetical protein